MKVVDLKTRVPDNEYFAHYESLVDISQKMLDAARRQDWGELSHLEMVCVSRIDSLPDLDRSVQLTPEGRRRKLRCLQKIVFNDKHIRYLMEPWMLRLSYLMPSGG